MTLRKVNFSILTVFSNHLAFLENYPPNSEIWVSIGGTGCGELTCYSGYAQIFSEKSYDSEKSILRGFDRFWKLTDFAQKVP